MIWIHHSNCGRERLFLIRAAYCKDTFCIKRSYEKTIYLKVCTPQNPRHINFITGNLHIHDCCIIVTIVQMYIFLLLASTALFLSLDEILRTVCRNSYCTLLFNRLKCTADKTSVEEILHSLIASESTQ